MNILKETWLLPPCSLLRALVACWLIVIVRLGVVWSSSFGGSKASFMSCFGGSCDSLPKELLLSWDMFVSLVKAAQFITF